MVGPHSTRWTRRSRRSFTAGQWEKRPSDPPSPSDPLGFSLRARGGTDSREGQVTHAVVSEDGRNEQ